MRAFIITSAALLTLFGTTAFFAVRQEEPYSARLGRIAEEINSRNDVTWQAENPQRFLNMKFEEVKGLMGVLEGGEPLPEVEFDEDQPQTNDAAFDARTKWRNCPSIGEIRDQANCGSCWAFGAVEAISDRICIETNQDVRISAQDLMSCCGNCGFGCRGGRLPEAWIYFANRGLVTGDLYGDEKTCQPYPLEPCAHHTRSAKYPACGSLAKTPPCKATCQESSGLDYNTDKRRGKKVYSINGESDMERELQNRGPFEVSFTVYEDFLTYKSGIYENKQGRFVGGHAVKVIGWGEENGVKYWIMANSWNESWGDNGYFKILKGHNHCGIENSAVAGIVA